jgi:hypothetical protein
MIDLQDLTPAMIERAYLGKPGCMCGCKGKYYTSTKVDRSSVNPAMVTKILRTIQANEHLLETGSSYFAAQVGGKEYVVYLSESV